MAKEYNVGDRLYLPVWVTEKETNLMMGPDKSTTITDAKFSYAYWHGKTGEGKVRYGEPGLLLTTEEVAEEYKDKAQRKIETLTKQLEEANETIKAFSESEDIVRTNFDAKVDENKELKSRNAELEALLKEVMATRDEAIRQNDELITENKKLKADCNEWKDTANERLNAVQTLSAERNKVMAGVDELKNTLVDRTKDVQHLTEENANLKAWYEEANKTASEAAEANDDLKAKIADLRNRVGEQLAQIQDLNAEIHFLKEERDLKAKLAQEWHDNAHSTAKGLDELKGRYDELDSVNKEQAEKIRKLDAQNAYLKRLSDAKKKMRIVLNNGNMYDVEVGDKVHPVYDMNNNLFFVKTEGGTVTSFLIGKEPGNIAGWYFV